MRHSWNVKTPYLTSQSQRAEHHSCGLPRGEAIKLQEEDVNPNELNKYIQALLLQQALK